MLHKPREFYSETQPLKVDFFNFFTISEEKSFTMGGEIGLLKGFWSIIVAFFKKIGF